ncbi:MAG: aminodeoxychorismate lyase [Gordonia sp. (in: high G+C Gram-positive bacteria)]
MSESILVTLDGDVLDPDVPFLYADDLAAVRGDGIFETMLLRDGRVCRVDAHLERLVRSAAMLSLPAPDLDRCRSAIETAAKAWTASAREDAEGVIAEGALRLVYTRGRESAGHAGVPTAYVTVSGVSDRVHTARAEGVSVVTLDRGFSIDLASAAPWQLLGAKTLSYATNMAALRHAAAEGFDDVIYLSSEGVVLEGPRSSVVAVEGDTLVTPPPEAGILTGTTQQAAFELAEREGWRTQIRVLRPADLIDADSFWLVSSVTLAARVTSLNGYVTPVSPDADKFSDLVHRAVIGD